MADVSDAIANFAVARDDRCAVASDGEQQRAATSSGAQRRVAVIVALSDGRPKVDPRCSSSPLFMTDDCSKKTWPTTNGLLIVLDEIWRTDA